MPGLSAAAKPTFLFWQWRIRLFVELLINLAPTWKTAEVAVVYEEVCMDFSADIGGVRGFFLGRNGSRHKAGRRCPP